ncbi:MAG: serine hydrolase [Patescibacteria group bacterium]|nr:serine hydrolase [Patescibacteria group bacterium]
MFALLVAFTFYMAFAPVQPALSAMDLGLKQQSFLPLASRFENEGEDIVVPVMEDPARVGIETTGRAATVIDWRTGRALFRKDADTPHPVASITKLMTALVVLDSGVALDEVIEVWSSDARPGNIPYIVPGERIRVDDLMHASLIASANGATIALARSTGMDLEDFAGRMNELAVDIGMSNANFVEPTGLDSGNVASARDVAILIRHALENDIVRDMTLKDSYSFTAETGLHHRLRSTDRLLDSRISEPPYGFLGGKTGYLPEAGYCFGAAAHNGDGERVIAVVLGAPSKQARFDEVSALIYWTFDAYHWPDSN